jgi:myo-inositol 2-dehydrogenase/D-chiro-inositol 1-dehydrogenase
MVRFALFGAGRIGKMHGENLTRRPDAKLLYVVDSKPEAARVLAEHLGAKPATQEHVFADKNVDAVLIASSTDTHADIAIAAARAKKAIFCEKPVDLRLERVDDTIREVEQAGVPMLVGFNRRFDASFRALKNQVDAGAVGTIEQVLIINRDPGLPDLAFLARSGGLFLDFTIHDFDMARWLLGEEPTEIFAWGAVLVDPRVATEAKDIDTAMLMMRTASNKMCHITNTRRAVYGYDQRIEVFGSKGMLRAENLNPTTVERFGAEGVVSDKPYPGFQSRYDAAYAAELSAFIEAVEKGSKVAPGPRDGRQVIVLANAAMESYETGKPVKL